MIYLILTATFLYLLYWFGLLPVSMKRAIIYVGHGSWVERRFGASFTSCSGWSRRVVRFRESRSYSFQLTGHIQQGAVHVEILDAGRTKVLCLSADNPSGVLSAQAGKRYFMNIHFISASGDYQLEWS